MELNYHNVDERGYSSSSSNSNFNPTQDSDLPYSPKTKTKSKTSKMLYEDDSRPAALETFKELALNSNSVSVQAFLEWEDIKEVMSRGYIDKETIGIIMKEVGIKSGFLDFAQFKEMVDMVNHVNAALEQNELEGLDDDADDEEGEGEADSFFPPGDDDDDDTMKWLDKQLKS